MKVDLHMHSMYSDGTLKPEELIEIINEKGLKICALTDHDTIMGVEEYVKAASKYGIRVIPGLELSTTESESIHVLGYFKSLDSIGDEFKKYLIDMQENRRNRMKQMVDNVNRIWGLNVDFNEILKKHPYMIERPHLADEIAKITGESKKDIFEKYIGNFSPAYVPTAKITCAEGVKMIRDAGGIAVLAHPYQYTKTSPWDLIENGVDGIEVFYFRASVSKWRKYRKYAKKHDLVMTGGSDFHRLTDDASQHSPIGEKEIEDQYVLKFLERIDNLK